LDGLTQSTIARRVSCQGFGLHSGDEVRLTLEPAGAETGLIFVLAEAGGRPIGTEIPARADHVWSTIRATTLALPSGSMDASRVRVSTVEHLLASVLIHRIDNLRILLEGSEIPVFDGSAAPFAALLREAGRVSQAAPRSEWVMRRPLEIREGDRWIRAVPSDRLRIHYTIDFPHPCIGRQSLHIPRLDETYFENELAPARTFGFVREVEGLREAGLARGGSFENALVLDDIRLLNTGGLRWPDEFVRHKVVDLLGDLALLGAPLRAQIEVEKGGHGLHHRLVRALLEAPDLLDRRDHTVAA